MMIDSGTTNKIKENKYKILRMSLLLGQEENKQETINNFEDAARDIDKMNDEIYLKEIEKKMYDTLTLEEEDKKLTGLVDYIGGRIEQRNSLLNDFKNITGYELNNLPPIKYGEKLIEYKDRLSNIKEYLSNIKEIDTLTNDVSNLENKLEISYKNKEKAEKKNEENEKILLEKFERIINRNENYRDISIEKIDELLIEIKEQVNESKKSLEIFNKSFNTLEMSGISKEEEQEYSSYVESAKDNYYRNKENEYILTIYKLLHNNEIEYNNLILKRDKINNLLHERLDLRKELSIKDKDIMYEIYELLDNQYINIEEEKKDLDEIDYLTNEITEKKAKIKELELDNQKVEILSLLKEFCIIDTFDEIENTNIKDEITKETNNDYSDDNYYNSINSELNNKESNVENIVNETEIKEETNDESTDVLANNNTQEEDFFSTDSTVPEEINNISSVSSITNEEMEQSVIPNDFGVDSLSTNELENNNKVETENSIFTEPTIEQNSEEPLTTEKMPEENIQVKDNQVVKVVDVINDDLPSVIEKANTVMKRVGKMLGVEVEQNEKIISIENKNEELSPTNDGSSDSNNENINNNNILNNEETINKVVPEKGISTDNIFLDTNNNQEDNSNKEEQIIEENTNNIFFNNNENNNVDNVLNDNFTLNNNPLENNSLNNSIFDNTLDNNILGNNNFWDNAYDDGGLNTLPDLPASNEIPSDNFFANNELPDLNMNIQNGNTEVQ